MSAKIAFVRKYKYDGVDGFNYDVSYESGRHRSFYGKLPKAVQNFIDSAKVITESYDHVMHWHEFLYKA